MLKLALKFEKIPLFIFGVSIKGYILGEGVATRVFQVEYPLGSFHPAGRLEFNVTAFDHLARCVVTFIMPGGEGTFVG